ncbi:NAD(P)-binding protein [Lophiostoma macrostomum CBS 122681]|uniref:NAD(P)-binding protein n=1 Tax=Lophiostoma macrostomum CBS 122681 TaxID=1314788 RepID=A0A6A6TG47_9PLEO|nr:NAD(P)-binding protein [Lophiostoma macrostomum CBS 122681]
MTSLIHPNDFPGGIPHTLGFYSRSRWSVKHPPVDPDVTFVGKNILIVGANTGLGFESAVKFAQKGAAKLILGVRSTEKGEQAKQEISKRAGMDSRKIEIAVVDLDSFSSVKLFVSSLEIDNSRLDVVLLNAGGVWPKYVKSSEGYETSLQVMVLSTTLLAILLLPLLRKSATVSNRDELPHITFVSSQSHMEVKAEDYTGTLLQAVNDEKQFSPFTNYGRNKLLAFVAMRYIAQATTKLDGSPEVIVNACCPFSTISNIARDFPWWFHWLMAPFVYLISRTTEEGSRTCVGATALDQSSHGKFWHHDWLYPYVTNQLLEDEHFTEQCWDGVTDILETTQPDLIEILHGRK